MSISAAAAGAGAYSHTLTPSSTWNCPLLFEFQLLCELRHFAVVACSFPFIQFLLPSFAISLPIRFFCHNLFLWLLGTRLAPNEVKFGKMRKEWQAEKTQCVCVWAKGRKREYEKNPHLKIIKMLSEWKTPTTAIHSEYNTGRKRSRKKGI